MPHHRARCQAPGPVFAEFLSLLIALVFLLSGKLCAGDSGRQLEQIDRGVVASRVDAGVYVSWRLLRSDPRDATFDVWRQIGAANPVKLNARPIIQTTDFLDREVPPDTLPTYTVRPCWNHQASAGSATTIRTVNDTSFVSIPLADKDTTFQKVGIADLDGDGKYDYVIKQPNSNVDPWHVYWKKSPGTYKLEAYKSDGTFLWRKDLGWAIEQGIWYSPWIAYDLNGDGRAEVAAKFGEGDPRDEDGRVTSGEEWVVVWDGLSGEEIARAPWPARSEFTEYNLASRNLIAIAYLDGIHPALLTQRGTYGRMIVEAYRLQEGELVPLWRFTNKDLGRSYQGQGAHFTLAADVDGDGKDEVLLGSATLDDDGTPCWTTGKGHPDAAYLADVAPHRPGLEMAYVMETRQQTGGLCLADARDGRLLWELQEPTKHVHGKGLCADIDVTVPGMEIYGADSESHQATGARWMFSADGHLLGSGDDIDFGFDIRTAYWDADLQKEIVRGTITNYGGLARLDRIEGRVQLIADVLGDWREEVITTVPGELRIYSTTIPAMDRRVCLMQDPIYRLGTAMNAMGYTQEPTLLTCLEATAPNMNLTLIRRLPDRSVCRVGVSAPLDAPLQGTVVLDATGGLSVKPAAFSVDLAPGARTFADVEVHPAAPNATGGHILATLELEGHVLRGQLPVERR